MTHSDSHTQGTSLNDPQTGPIKVLVIDDSNTIRRSAEMFLRQAGFDVILAEDGFDALGGVLARLRDVRLRPLARILRVGQRAQPGLALFVKFCLGLREQLVERTRRFRLRGRNYFALRFGIGHRA